MAEEIERFRNQGETRVVVTQNTASAACTDADLGGCVNGCVYIKHKIGAAANASNHVSLLKHWLSRLCMGMHCHIYFASMLQPKFSTQNVATFASFQSSSLPFTFAVVTRSTSTA